MCKNVFFSEMPIPVKSESCGNRGWWRGRDCCGCQQSRHFASLSRRLSTIPLFSHRKCQNWALRAKWKVLRKMFLLRLRQKSLGMPKLEFIQVIRNFLACGLKCVGRFSCTWPMLHGVTVTSEWCVAIMANHSKLVRILQKVIFVEMTFIKQITRKFHNMRLITPKIESETTFITSVGRNFIK